jgi:hypothetical protein
MEIYHNGRNAGDFGENAWTAYNAVVEYVDHVRSTRGTDEDNRSENRLESITIGTGAKVKDRAWTTALALA